MANPALPVDLVQDNRARARHIKRGDLAIHGNPAEIVAYFSIAVTQTKGFIADEQSRRSCKIHLLHQMAGFGSGTNNLKSGQFRLQPLKPGYKLVMGRKSQGWYGKKRPHTCPDRSRIVEIHRMPGNDQPVYFQGLTRTD